ncbi:hypothetical protein ANN_26927 [Periplaneta americana]|uniref:Uncharacterized protein n=1 Tax=Periplaneta americana TaxID=6978 RepID=A0ABQ8RWL2_PERAM|nr:hypothetical protein ANN_26927 [Periplaneta americana]
MPTDALEIETNSREGPRPTSRLLASRPHAEAEVDDHPTRMELWGRLWLYRKRVLGYFFSSKGDKTIGLTSLLPLQDDCRQRWAGRPKRRYADRKHVSMRRFDRWENVWTLPTVGQQDDAKPGSKKR